MEASVPREDKIRRVLVTSSEGRRTFLPEIASAWASKSRRFCFWILASARLNCIEWVTRIDHRLLYEIHHNVGHFVCHLDQSRCCFKRLLETDEI